MKKLFMLTLIFASFSSFAYEMEIYKEYNAYGATCASAEKRALQKAEAYINTGSDQGGVIAGYKTKKVQISDCNDLNYSGYRTPMVKVKVIGTY